MSRKTKQGVGDKTTGTIPAMPYRCDRQGWYSYQDHLSSSQVSFHDTCIRWQYI